VAKTRVGACPPRSGFDDLGAIAAGVRRFNQMAQIDRFWIERHQQSFRVSALAGPDAVGPGPSRADTRPGLLGHG